MSADDLRLYLPFVDGEIGYSCAGCGAPCCRDGAIGATGESDDLLNDRRPAIALFRTESRGSGYSIYAKLNPGCLFLAQDGRCGIEVELGRAAKPHLCRSHPLYFSPYLEQGVVICWLLGPYCDFVDPRSSDAPAKLEIVTRAAARDLHAENLARGLYQPAPLPRPWTGDALRALVAFEERVRDARSVFPNLVDYLAWQEAYGERFARSFDPDASVSDGALAAATERMQRLDGLVGTLLGSGSPRPELERLLDAFGSTIRLRLLGLTGEIPRYTASWQRLGAEEVLSLAPRVILALSHYLRAYDGERAPTYSTVIESVERFARRLYVLAILEDEIAPGAAAELPEGAASELLLQASSGQHTTLGSLLRELCDGGGLPRLITALDAAADLIDLELITLGGASPRPERPATLVLAEGASVRWEQGAICLETASGSPVQSASAALLVLLHEFSTPRDPAEVIQLFRDRQQLDVSAIVEQLRQARLLVPAERV